MLGSLLALLDRLTAASEDPGAALEDIAEFFGPLLFRPHKHPPNIIKGVDNAQAAVRSETVYWLWQLSGGVQRMGAVAMYTAFRAQDCCACHVCFAFHEKARESKSASADAAWEAW